MFQAPGAGFEPATHWLTASCATVAPPRNEIIHKKTIQIFYTNSRKNQSIPL